MLVVQNAWDLKRRGKVFLILVKFEGKKLKTMKREGEDTIGNTSKREGDISK